MIRVPVDLERGLAHYIRYVAQADIQCIKQTIMATPIEIRTAIIKAISSRLTMMCIGTHNDDENNFGIRDVHTHYIGYFTDLEMVMYGFEDEWDIPFSLSDPDLIPKAAKFFKAWEDWHARNLVIYIDGV